MTDWLIAVFGLLAVTAMMLCYALEQRSSLFILLFAVACLAASAYATLIRSWPFAAVECLWALIAFPRWPRTS